MRCDEIRERFVDLLYDELGTPAASPELRAHIDSCPECRKELEGLRVLQDTLRTWKDEASPAPVRIPEFKRRRPAFRFPIFKMLRYAGVAALVTLAFLALSNAELTWNKEGFSFRTHAFSRQTAQNDFYTKSETRRVMKEALRDSESFLIDYNSQQLNAALDLVDKQMGQEMRYVRGLYSQTRAKN